MKLIIAEKPSVASTIAKVLEAKTRCDGYVEGNGYIISWCIGHLVELAQPEAYGSQLAKWDIKDLPILPTKFEFVVSDGKTEQMAVLLGLMNRDDVTEVVNGCDAGREGELIFRLVYNFAQCKKPMTRLWISSMEDSAIEHGFQTLKQGSEMENLYHSALCRSQADWIVGMNASRLFSCLYNQPLNVGRVMSPTLSMIVERSAQITAFQSKPFYNVVLKCGENPSFHLHSQRFDQKAQAEAVLNACGDEVKIQNVQEQEKSKNPPKLYDLTTLQREANRKQGFTAQQTLDYVQSLYEKKLCTYPRTDSKFLTEDMEHTLSDLSGVAQKVLGLNKEGFIPNTNSVINNSKVTDHHAIIPTSGLENCDIETLALGEREIVKLLCTRLLSAMSEPHKYTETVVTALCGDTTFTAKGKTVLLQGYLAFEQSEKEEQEETLPKVTTGDTLKKLEGTLKEGKTSPPKQYTEDTILSAMERAGREEDVDTEFCGIGTPATRAGIIEKLVSVQLIQRQTAGKTKHLVPTEKGIALSTVLPESLQSPLLTGGWEEKLKEVEEGSMTATQFMDDISSMISDIVATYEKVPQSEKLFPSRYASIGTCPRCGKDVVDTKKAYSCEDRDCGFVLWKENKFFSNKGKELTEKLAKELLAKGKITLKGCKSEKSSKTYDCYVLLDDDGGKFVNFKLEFINNKKK